MADNDHKAWYIHAATILTALAALAGAGVGVYKGLGDASDAPAPQARVAPAVPAVPARVAVTVPGGAAAAAAAPATPVRTMFLVQLDRIEMLAGASGKRWRFTALADGKPVLALPSRALKGSVPFDLELRESDPSMFKATLVPGEEVALKVSGVRAGGLLARDIAVEGEGVLTADGIAPIAVKADDGPSGSFVFHFSVVPIRND